VAPVTHHVKPLPPDHGWVGVEDLRTALGNPGPWTSDERWMMDLVVAGVNNYIHRVRPDLIPFELVDGRVGKWGAFTHDFHPPFAQSHQSSVWDKDALWAAVQLAMHWFEIRGSHSGQGLDALGGGFPVYAVPNYVQEALQLGRSHAPVVA